MNNAGTQTGKSQITSRSRRAALFWIGAAGCGFVLLARHVLEGLCPDMQKDFANETPRSLSRSGRLCCSGNPA